MTSQRRRYRRQEQRSCCPSGRASTAPTKSTCRPNTTTDDHHHGQRRRTESRDGWTNSRMKPGSNPTTFFTVTNSHQLHTWYYTGHPLTNRNVGPGSISYFGKACILHCSHRRQPPHVRITQHYQYYSNAKPSIASTLTLTERKL